jgi:peptidyl-prolyl cis-trans isomerase C
LSNFFSARLALVCGFAVLGLFLLWGCAPASPASQVESGARKVVTFDGGQVTEGEVIEGVQRLNTAQSAATGQQPKGDIEPGSPQFEAAKRQVVPQLVAFNLAKAYAKENGIEVSEQEVEDEIATVRDEVAQQAEAAGQGGDPEEVFQEALSQFGYTEAAFREEVRTSLLVRKVQEDVVGDVGPTEEEVQDFYDENKATQFTIPERRCIRHILFTEDEEDTADEVQQELEDGGDFTELAEEYSKDPGTKDRGGELGCQPEGGFVPEFDEAAFGAEEGDIVGPVETDFGFHIIEVTDIQEEEETPLEEAAPEIEERLSEQDQASEFDAWIQSQLEERNVEYLPGYDPNEQILPGGPKGVTPEGEIPEEGVPPQGAPPEGVPPEGKAP